jgi:hypothetical protein
VTQMFGIPRSGMARHAVHVGRLTVHSDSCHRRSPKTRRADESGLRQLERNVVQAQAAHPRRRRGRELRARPASPPGGREAIRQRIESARAERIETSMTVGLADGTPTGASTSFRDGMTLQDPPVR